MRWQQLSLSARALLGSLIRLGQKQLGCVQGDPEKGTGLLHAVIVSARAPPSGQTTVRCQAPFHQHVPCQRRHGWHVRPACVRGGQGSCRVSSSSASGWPAGRKECTEGDIIGNGQPSSSHNRTLLSSLPTEAFSVADDIVRGTDFLDKTPATACTKSSAVGTECDKCNPEQHDALVHEPCLSACVARRGLQHAPLLMNCPLLLFE